MDSVAALVLAAGDSSRLGLRKQLLPYQGDTLLSRTISACTASRVNRVVVVVGAYREEISQSIASHPVAIVRNEDWSSGIGTSISRGIDFLSSQQRLVDAAVIVLCDQPYLSTEFIDGLLDCRLNSGMPIVAAEYGGTFGVPALFDRRFFPELSLLRKTGAKQTIAAHLSEVHLVPFQQGEIDIDTLHDYQSLLARS